MQASDGTERSANRTRDRVSKRIVLPLFKTETAQISTRVIVNQ